MAGTIQRAGASVLRRATAAGLGGLAFALFVGVMAFAITTNPKSTPDASMTQYLATAGQLVQLSTAVAPESSAVVSSVGAAIGPAAERTSAATVARRDAAEVDALLALALDDRTPAQGERERAAFAAEQLAGMNEALPAAEVASATSEPVALPLTSSADAFDDNAEPDLLPGDRATATLSFYYCQRGVEGLHPGDGGGFCGVMRDGTVVYPGAAACAYKYLGQRFRILGDPLERVYVCADTGSAVHGLHRDIWFMSSDDGWDWQLDIGQVATIEVLP